jgi:hypothetical protein
MEFNPKVKRLKESSAAALANGRCLLADAEWLDYDEYRTRAHFLTMIAQEEFAKSFLLGLVLRGVISWDPRLLRAARDHVCKQLLCIVMDYLNPDYAEFKERCDAVILRHELSETPRKIADAINLLGHERIGRWNNPHWEWEDEPDYHRDALDVAEGKQDRAKQDFLYVRLAADGGIASSPRAVDCEELKGERERAERMASLAENMLDERRVPGLDYEDVARIFRAVFSTMMD